MATGGPLAWGLCYNREMSPSQSYCDDFYKYTYPCTPGAEYYGRGAIPIYWYVASLRRSFALLLVSSFDTPILSDKCANIFSLPRYKIIGMIFKRVQVQGRHLHW